MIGFAVYSATVEPDQLYANGDTDRIDANTTTETVWSNDRPLDLVVDLTDRRLWWAFQAEHKTKARRTGHFIAAYHGGLDLFRGFASELRQLHDTDGWTIPYGGSIDQDIGFDLWRLASTVETEAKFDQVLDSLSDRGDTLLEVGMTSYRSAFEAVQAIEAAGIECTVAVDSKGGIEDNDKIDLVLVPGANDEFVIHTAETQEAIEQTEESTAQAPITEQDDNSGRGATRSGFTVRIAAAVLVALAGFSIYSFFTLQPVRPISGLATFGGIAGATGAVVFWHATDGGTDRLRDRVTAAPDWLVLAATAGAFAGFVYPKIIWQAGLFTGRNGFLFGSISTVSGSLPATFVYVGTLFIGAMGVITVGRVVGNIGSLRLDQIVRATAGFGIYGIGLLIGTGLAQAVWYGLIPAI